MEFMFFVGDTLLLPDAPIGSFQHATQIFITLDNQNNAIREETVLHSWYKSSEAYPVQSGVNVFLQIREQGCEPSTPASDYSTPQDINSSSASSIVNAVRSDCKQVGAERLFFTPEYSGTPSLSSDGAISMHIADVLDWTLMAIGRWHSLVFMVYIQQHISSFSTGVYVHMSAQPWFHHL